MQGDEMMATPSPESPPLSSEGAASSPLSTGQPAHATRPANRPTKPKQRGASSSRRDAFVLLIVLAFVLNSLNGRTIVDSVHSQLEYLTASQAPPCPESRLEHWNRTEDTAIVITSSWIPSHPSTYMIEMVLNSTDRLKGLSPTAPIVVTVDHVPWTDFHGLPNDLKERLGHLEQYTKNLYLRHMANPRIHIVPGATQLHIGGAVMKAMDLIEANYPSVRYLYYLQHDFYFTKDVDHAALAKAMDAHSKVNYVRFPKRANLPGCGNERPIEYNLTAVDGGADAVAYASGDRMGRSNSAPTKSVLYPTERYSDNNHLVRFAWYKQAIASLGYLQRPPEDVLNGQAINGCRGNASMGLYVYPEVNIGHLDGRHTTGGP